jgi:hypothetical protein
MELKRAPWKPLGHVDLDKWEISWIIMMIGNVIWEVDIGSVELFKNFRHKTIQNMHDHGMSEVWSGKGLPQSFSELAGEEGRRARSGMDMFIKRIQ